MGKWIVIGVLAIAIAIGIGAYFGDHDGPPWRDDQAQVITTDSGQTIVVQDRDHGFFPFFLIPFLFLGFLWFAIGRRFRGGPGYGCGPSQNREEWLRDWHRREHETGNSAPES